MSQTYSTVNRDMAVGRVYSTQRTAGSRPPAPRRPAQQAVPLRHQAQQPVVPRAQAPAVPPLLRFTFPLNCANLPAASRAFPGCTGSVALEGRAGEPFQVDGQIAGLPPGPDPAIEPALWLIHDLTVPTNLDPADLAGLPRGPSGTGNQPGSVFTLDGGPATYGPSFNTISLAVSPGRFTRTSDSGWRLQTTLDPERNQAFHPLFFAGPEALADINATVPSGTLAHVFTDLFMRPATVHSELPLQSRYLDRLKAVTARQFGSGQQSVLDGSGFTRAAVTLEGILRATPLQMPTRESCILQGNRTGA